MVLFDNWALHQKEQEKKGKRRYAHFDPKISFARNVKSFREFFADTKKVEKHSFYPFIWSTLIAPRFKRVGEDAFGNPIRAHSKKERSIAYAAHYDAFIYSWYSAQLSHLYEEELVRRGIRDCVLAYLKTDKKTNFHYAKDVFDFIKQRDECVVLAFDLRAFFDSLDHELLKEKWKGLLRVDRLPKDHFKVYRSITDFQLIEKKCLMGLFPEYKKSVKRRASLKRICEPREYRDEVRGGYLLRGNPYRNSIEGSARNGAMCGIPQGSPMSACLSNLYMLDFDESLYNLIKQCNGGYWRYCDDLLIVCPEENRALIEQHLFDLIAKHELKIQTKKTDVTKYKRNSIGALEGWSENVRNGASSRKSMQYLGFEFDGKRTFLRSSSIARYQSRLRARVRETIKAVHSKRSSSSKVSMKRFFDRYSERGEGNFITYALRAAEHMQSNEIRLQVKDSVALIRRLVTEKQNDVDFLIRLRARREHSRNERPRPIAPIKRLEPAVS